MPPTTATAPDTTAVILNWARLENVVQIVSVLCDPALEGIIAEIRIWNNNPNVHLDYTVSCYLLWTRAQYLSDRPFKNFALTGCSIEKLWIHNSSKNEYFQARYLACVTAATNYCFIQDDDYIIRPPTIQAMYNRMLDAISPPESIHLITPVDHLKTSLLHITTPSIHSAFAWLGYGTLVQTSHVRSFLDLVSSPSPAFSDDEMKMADNYYALLANRVPETWIVPGEEIGEQDKAFTVGEEGDDRNWLYMQKAVNRLVNLLSAGELVHPYVDRSIYPSSQQDSVVSRVPCISMPYILETNAPLLPTLRPVTISDSGLNIRDLHKARVEELDVLDPTIREQYVQYPLCAAVDGDEETSFWGIQDAQQGEYITLILPNPPLANPSPTTIYPDSTTAFLGVGFRMVWIVDEDTVSLIRENAVFEVSHDGIEWTSPDDLLLQAYAQRELHTHDARNEVTPVPGPNSKVAGAQKWECTFRFSIPPPDTNANYDVITDSIPRYIRLGLESTPTQPMRWRVWDVSTSLTVKTVTKGSMPNKQALG